MALAAWLTATCTILRVTEQTTDPYNQPNRTTWTRIAADVPCRLVERTAKLIISQTAESARVETYTLLLDVEVDLREGDRVSEITTGTATDSRTFTVETVLWRQRRQGKHHQSVNLNVVG